jgi:hypothetical protein
MISKTADQPPFKDRIFESDYFVSRAWQAFFRRCGEVLRFIGSEQTFPLVNNQGSAADITPLKFDKSYTTVVFIDYFVQRITSSTKKNQAGIKIAVYDADANSWVISEYGTSGPDAAGITFSITSTGQVQYTSSNLAGTETISRIVFRTRELAAKAYYSKAG